MIKSLDEESLRKLQGLEATIEVLRVPLKRQMDLMGTVPAEARQLIAAEVKFYQDKLIEAQQQRAALMGETLQLWGGNVKVGQEIDCRVALRLLTHRAVDFVEMTIKYNPEKVRYVASVRGKDTENSPLAVEQIAPDVIKATQLNVSGDKAWPPGKYEIGFIRFGAVAGSKQTMTELKVQGFKVSHKGNLLPFKELHGVLFIDEA